MGARVDDFRMAAISHIFAEDRQDILPLFASSVLDDNLYDTLTY